VAYVRATTSHYFLYRQSTEAGLSFDDIRAVNLAPSDGLSAFAGGDIDAWANDANPFATPVRNAPFPASASM
jgi:sulfonate transport system substrate-binding protein